MAGRAKVERNEPCPCGSGKKHKHCCLDSFKELESMRLKLRQAEDKVIDAVVEFAKEKYDNSIVEEAWSDFTFSDACVEEPDEADEFHSSFIPWFVFDWIPDPEAERPEGARVPTDTLLSEYVTAHGDRLSDFDKRFIDAVAQRPYSFCSIAADQGGPVLRMHDIMIDTPHSVLEPDATDDIPDGSILFTRIVELDGAAILIGAYPTLIPAELHDGLIELRDKIAAALGRPLDAAGLAEFELDLREAYFEIRHLLFHPEHAEDGEAS